MIPSKPYYKNFSFDDNEGINQKINDYQVNIAVIGISCRFPGAKDHHEFWRNLEAGKSSVTEIPSERWKFDNFYSDFATEQDKTYTKYGGFIQDIDKFDASFFNISSMEAKYMDPQQRIVLELAWSCIEDAGYQPRGFRGTKMGLFLGVTTSDYHTLVVQENILWNEFTATGLSPSILANRVSYALGFNGPSEPVDTACASSLVSIHRAIESIERGLCDTAIAGGVNALLSYKYYISFGKAGMLSPDGKCKSFDKGANGYVRGEGCGLVLLKPLDQALADNDHIYGVIKGMSVNHGGHARNLTSPSAFSQSKVIIDACTRAKFPPETLSYIETHGTGTPLGDPIEIYGLKRAFKRLFKLYGRSMLNNYYCGLGSLKTNIGHLEAAAGIAGMIKVLLSMRHGKLPQSLNFTQLNPKIDLADTPFYFVTKTREWTRIKDEYGEVIPRRAGISSFGLGGSNAHIVLEEFNRSKHSLSDFYNASADNVKKKKIFVLSARDEHTLLNYALNLSSTLKRSNESISAADVAYTLQVGRESMSHRLAVVASTIDDLVEKLECVAKKHNSLSGVWIGSIKDKPDQRSEIESSVNDRLLGYIKERKMEYVAKLWVEGNDVPWYMFIGDREVKRIPLPTYPFKKERHWFSKTEKKASLKSENNECTKGQSKQTQSLAVVNANSFEQLWKREVFDVDFDLDTELKYLDSLVLIRLSDGLHREFGIVIEFNEFQSRFNTPRKIIDDAKEKTVDIDKPVVSSTIFNSVDKNYEKMIASFTSCNQEKWYYPLRKNGRPIIFLITSMRHGSSLTSFILNAHPDIYAPQGLYLLPFANLSQRAEMMKNQILFLDEGLINTVKDLWGTDQIGAEKIVNDWTQEKLPVQEVYRNIQEQCAPRLLVDRGTVYGLDQAVLNRAEHLFDSVKYIHLVRHPYAVLRSGTALLAKTAFMRKLITREQFESESLKIHLNGLLDKLWSTTHINFLDFESQIDSNKCHRLKFESLVEDPATNLKKLCNFLNISYTPSMVTPYDDSKNVKLHNMTGKNGIAAIDPNVMKQTQINPKNANNWKLYSPKKALSASTLYFMKGFEYETPDQNYDSGFKDNIFMRIAGSGIENPVFAIPGTGGNLHPFQSIFSDYERPVLGIKLGDYAPNHSFSELGAFLSSNISNQIDSCSLIGYSSGALIAWETAAALKKRGVIVERLILVDRNPYFPANELFVHEIEDAKRRYISAYGQGLDHDALIMAFVVFANTFYGLKGNQLVNMIDALLKMRHDQESMKRAVEDYIPGVKRQSLDEFILNFLNSRELIETYDPTSMTDHDFDRVLIEPSGSPYAMNTNVMSDMRSVLIDDCDHFSIIKSPELNTIVRELL